MMHAAAPPAPEMEVARRVTKTCTVPIDWIGLLSRNGLPAPRVSSGKRLKVAAEENAWLVRQGQLMMLLQMHPAASTIGLHLGLDLAPAEHALSAQQAEIYLSGLDTDSLTLGMLRNDVEAWLQTNMASGALDLPPCETAEEWRVFRLALGDGLHARFGLAIDDCFIVDLVDGPGQIGESPSTPIDSTITTRVNMVRVLRAATAAVGTARGAWQQVTRQAASDWARRRDSTARARISALADSHARNRLFIELPRLAAALRRPNLPQGVGVVQKQLALAQRIDRLAARSALPPMPSMDAVRLGIERRLPLQDLDEGWAALARLGHAAADAAPFASIQICLDDAERVVANLESHVAWGAAL